jgi:putative transposase
MSFVMKPWHLLLLVTSASTQRENEQKIEMLQDQLRMVLKRQPKRIRLTDDERRVLAVKGKTLGRRALQQVSAIVTPDTILRWHRQLIAKKWDYSHKRQSPGRPKVAKEIEELVLRMAKENPTWGYDRIQGALKNLGHEISDTTVGNILKAHGVEPAPERKKTTTWKTFIKSHWDVLAAIDFTTVEVWTTRGLVTYYLLFVMHLATRRVYFAGCTPNPDGARMKIVAKDLTAYDGFLKGKTYLLMDRDDKFTTEFQKILADEGVESVLLPPKSPNLNSQIERFMLSIKSECLDRMIFFGEQSLRNAVNQWLLHYHAERNHQGLDNQLIEPSPEVGQTTGTVECRERLGGLLNYYYRRAA